VIDGESPAASSGWVRTSYSAGLSGRRNRNTGPEVLLRREVHRLGLRFRLHQRLAGRFSVDFALPRFRVAVLVDGCFWHGCPEHGPAVFRGPNSEKWAAKLADNRIRDERCKIALEQVGWTVVRFWECAVRRDAAMCAQAVEKLCRGKLPSSASTMLHATTFG
jgi:DNA mismatch endonuclease (patch repair protein)